MRDKTPEFVPGLRKAVQGRDAAGVQRYSDFLEREYCRAARDEIGVSAHPNGAGCYAASVRGTHPAHQPEKDVHALGLAQIDLIMSEMKGIAERSFQTSDVAGAADDLEDGSEIPLQKPRGAHRVLAGGARSREAAAPNWFGLMPKADVAIEPCPGVSREKRDWRIQRAGRRRKPPGTLLHQRLSGRAAEPIGP